MQLLPRAALRYARKHGYRGDDLPLGWRNSYHDCPMARATGGRMPPLAAQEIVPWTMKHPLVAAFIVLFDFGYYKRYATTLAAERAQWRRLSRQDEREKVPA